MQRSANDFWVGLFVLVGAAALLFLALQSANLLSLNFSSTSLSDSLKPTTVRFKRTTSGLNSRALAARIS